MEYSALDTDANEIRLLTLLPNDKKGRVCCSLKHVSLINPPEYVALSYCWGDQSVTKEITINGVPVQVATNLDFCGWALYTGEAAWVGQEADDSGLAVDFIQNFQSHLRGLGRAERQVEVDLPPSTHSAFLRLLGQPYWRRVWVIQEIALSPFTVVHCGHLCFPWKLLASAIESICNSHSSGPSLPRPKAESTNTLAMTPSVLNIWNLNQFNLDAFESKPVRFFEALHRSLDAQSTEPRDKVFALLGLVYDAAMYLPVPNYRQSLRAISIGMAISGISTTRVLDLVPLLGRGCNDLSDLPSWTPSWFNFDQRSSERQLKYLAQGRPQFQLRSSDRDIKAHKYAAAGQTMAKVQISNEVLHPHAYQFDEVDGLTQTLSEGGLPLLIKDMSRFVPDTNRYKEVGTLMESAFRALALGGGSFPSTILHRLDVLCRCIQVPSSQKGPRSKTSLPMSDSSTSLQSPHDSSPETNSSQGEESHALTTLEWLIHGIKRQQHSRRTIPLISEEDRYSSRSDPVFVSLSKSTQEILRNDMRFMTTKKGYVGWAHSRTEQGDKIFLLPGCSVPVILRPRAEGGYTVVGDAYVQGIMDGEVVGDDQDIPWTHIEIH